MPPIPASHPIVLGPMSNASSAELTAAVSNAGGLGSLAGALRPPAAIVDSVARIRQLTSRPF
ncbi:nitronate monooxygenase [Massilia sp. 9096]|uniref:nitronate monooxygenase n=1 Tax=Massilia sp. 9096 TaxID=1500894 RepID=UPI0023A997C0|nr:nitronate monooxygenase [Massilia sp. 9096]